jgi:hypothetical protein
MHYDKKAVLLRFHIVTALESIYSHWSGSIMWDRLSCSVCPQLGSDGVTTVKSYKHGFTCIGAVASKHRTGLGTHELGVLGYKTLPRCPDVCDCFGGLCVIANHSETWRHMANKFAPNILDVRATSISLHCCAGVFEGSMDRNEFAPFTQPKRPALHPAAVAGIVAGGVAFVGILIAIIAAIVIKVCCPNLVACVSLRFKMYMEVCLQDV